MKHSRLIAGGSGHPVPSEAHLSRRPLADSSKVGDSNFPSLEALAETTFAEGITWPPAPSCSPVNQSQRFERVLSEFQCSPCHDMSLNDISLSDIL